MVQKTELSVDEVFNMKVDDLRKELKKKRLSTAGKKSILQFRLVEFIEQSNEKKVTTDETINEEEQMETDEPEINRTFTIEDESVNDEKISGYNLRDATPTNTVNLILDEEKSAVVNASLKNDLSCFEVKSRPRAHRSSIRKSLRATAQAESPVNKAESSKENLEDVDKNRETTPSRTKTPSRIGDRFAKAHAKEIEKMESLKEHKDRILKRHQDLTDHVPESIKKLATPKATRQLKSRTEQPAWKLDDPKNMTFKFGDNDVNDYSKIVTTQKKETVKNSPVARIKKSILTNHRDVKTLTRPTSSIPRPKRAVTRNVQKTTKVIPPTLVDDTSFVSFMATPKGKTPNRVRKTQGYTPYTGKRTFVDTTVLTDREYQLALEEGLIPGKSDKKRTNLEIRQAENKKKRDDIIALKRKMNIK